MAQRTESEWDTFIRDKVKEVLAQDVHALEDGPLASISSAADSRFPLTIDHTLLKQDATPAQIDKLCDEAIKYGFKVSSNTSKFETKLILSLTVMLCQQHLREAGS